MACYWDVVKSWVLYGMCNASVRVREGRYNTNVNATISSESVMKRCVNNTGLTPIAGVLVLSITCMVWPSAGLYADDSEPTHILTPSGDGDSFTFETDLMRGTIRLDGRYHGVTQLTDKRTGKQVIDPRYSALNFFKLMSVNLVMGEPRGMERTIQSAAHWVEVKWAATPSHQGELTARYEVVAPNAIDLTLTVRSNGTYRDYEVFMPSYFDKNFRPYVYLQKRDYSSNRDRQSAELVLVRYNPVFRGTVVVFPRDAHVAGLCIDGRWDRSEWDRPTVQMCPMRPYARCLALLTDEQKQLGIVLMSRPGDCYAISTRYHADEEANRLTSYSAFDLSLFGDDMIPGYERTVKVRLALTPLDDALSEPLDMYQAFLDQYEGVTP